MEDNLNKSLEQLKKQKWDGPIPNSEDSYALKKGYELHRKKIKDYSNEDLRYVLNQKESPEIFVPLVLKKLDNNILEEGDLYPGDLLYGLMRLDVKFWVDNKSLLNNLIGLIVEKKSIIEEDPYLDQDIKDEMFGAFNKLKKLV